MNLANTERSTSGMPAFFRWSRVAAAGVLLLLGAGTPAIADVLSAHDAAIARDAFAEADRGNWSKAEDIIAGASDKLPAKILLWADLQRPAAGHDFGEISQFIDANPDWPAMSTLRTRAEDIFISVPDSTLKSWFERHKPITPFAKLKFVDLKAAAGQAPDAAQQIRDIWIADDFGAGDQKLILARYADTLRPQDHIARLDRLLWQDKPADAKRMAALVPADWRLLADARMKLAASAKKAEAAVARVPPNLRDDPGLAYERVRWYRRKDQDDRAVQIMESARTQGHPEIWWPERQILARRLLQKNDNARAYRIVDAHDLTEGAAFVDAEFTAGWIALRFLKDPAKAYPHFVRIYDAGTVSTTLARGAYWAGRAAQAQGWTELATGWYEKAARYSTTYYGQLASAMPDVSPPPKPELEPRATAQEQAAFDKKELVHAARLLEQIGQDDRVRPFLVRLSELAQTPADHALIADLAEELGRPDLGVTAARKALFSGVSLMRAGYPLIAMPRNAGAEQALLLALTRQESAFDVRARSPSGARGLMQLMPATAKQVSGWLSIPYTESRLTTDGTYNVTLGQAYLDSLIANFNGSYLLAIAAYNAGAGSVSHWLDQFGDPRSPDVDAVDWVEMIPYGETRNYVQRVLENLQVYRMRIGDTALAFSLEADLRR